VSRRHRGTLVVILLLIASASTDVTAQGPRQGGVPNARREQLEQRLRQNTGEIVRRRLGLTDDQMTRLQATNRRFEQQRTSRLAREREIRSELRQQVLAGDGANQNRVAQLLDQVLELERQRLDLLQTEQKELATFLTPVQRAKLLTLQQQLRTRTQQLRRNQTPGRAAPPVRREINPEGQDES